MPGLSHALQPARDGCTWLGISQAGSKGRLFDRIVKARELAIKHSSVEVAQEQFRSKQPMRRTERTMR